MPSIASVLLRISGDDSGGESALERMSRRLKAFGGEEAEATADVNAKPAETALGSLASRLQAIDSTQAQARVDAQTAGAKIELERLQARLTALGKQEASPQVTLQTARTVAQIERVEARLAKLSASNVTVDVNVDQDGAAQSAAQRLAGRLTILGGNVSTTSKTFGALGIPVSFARVALLGLLPVVAAVGSGLLSLVPALVSASGALGAMGVAAGAVGLAVKALAAGGMAQFNRDVEKAGSTSNIFAASLKRTRNALINVTSGGVDAVFARLGPAMEQAAGKAGVLRGAFTNLGNQVATAGESFLRFLSSGPILAKLNRLIVSAGGAFKPLESIARSVVRVLLTIAQAAMPLLIRTLNAAAGAARRFADGFGTVGQTQGKLERMFGTLKQLGRILLNFGSFIAGIFRAFGQSTGGVLNGLESATKAMARFTNGSGFKAGVQTFIRLLVDMGRFAGNVGRLVVGAFRIIAPALRPITDGLKTGVNALANFVNSGSASKKLGPIFQQIGSVLRTAIAYGVDVFKRLIQAIKPAVPILKPLAALVGGALKGAFAALKPVVDVAIFAIGLLAKALGAIGTVLAPFSSALSKIGYLVGTVFAGGIVSAVGKVLSAFKFIPGLIGPILGVFGRLLQSAGAAMSILARTAGQLISGAIKPLGAVFEQVGVAVGLAVGGMRSAVAAGFGVIRSVTTAVWGVVRSVITTVVGAVRGVVTAGFGVIRTVTSTAFGAVRSVISTVFNAVRSVVTTVVGAVRSAVTTAWNAVRSVTTSAFNGVKSTVTGVFNSIKSFVSDAVAKVKETISLAWLGLKTIASRTFGAMTGAISSVFNGAKGVVSTVASGVTAALKAVTDLGKSFFDSGVALIQNLANGIVKGFGFVYDKIKGGLKFARGLLPFSEPKDASSPMRGLAKSGEAIGKNLAAGVPAGMDYLRRTVRSNLDVVPNVGGSFAARGVAASAPFGGGGTTNNTSFSVTTPTVPSDFGIDPAQYGAAAAQQILASMRARGGLALAG